jgi:hypothetical protein
VNLQGEFCVAELKNAGFSAISVKPEADKKSSFTVRVSHPLLLAGLPADIGFVSAKRVVTSPFFHARNNPEVLLSH